MAGFAEKPVGTLPLPVHQALLIGQSHQHRHEHARRHDHPQCQPCHRHQAWLGFLRLIKSSVDGDEQVHLICDNYATHKHPKVQAWAARNLPLHFYFTPTSALWLNMIERFFCDLSEKALRRGSFYNVDDLIGAIDGYINAHNTHPKPFIWTTSASDSLAKLKGDGGRWVSCRPFGGGQ